MQHPLDPLADCIPFLVERGDLTRGNFALALGSFHLVLDSLDLALGGLNLVLDGLRLALGSLCKALGGCYLALRHPHSFRLRGKLLAQLCGLGLGCGACLALSLYDLHSPQHLLLERLKLIHTDTGTHIRKYRAKQVLFGLSATVQNGASIEWNPAGGIALGSNDSAKLGERCDEPGRPVGQLVFAQCALAGLEYAAQKERVLSC